MKNTVTVLDNFYDEHTFKTIENFFTDEFTAWYWKEVTSANERALKDEDCIVDENSFEVPQMTHIIQHENNLYSDQHIDQLCCSGLAKLRQHGILWTAVNRIKANMLIKRSDFPKGCYHPAHIDWISDNPMMSMIVYLNDSDGDTFIFNESGVGKKPLTIDQTVTPKRNRAIIFPSNRWHASSSPINSERRLVLNFVLNVVG